MSRVTEDLVLDAARAGERTRIVLRPTLHSMQPHGFDGPSSRSFSSRHDLLAGDKPPVGKKRQGR